MASTDETDQRSHVRRSAAITLDGALAAIAAGRQRASELGYAVVIHVSDAGGHTVAVARMDGAPLFSLTVAEKKSWTVIAAGVDSRDLAADLTSSPVMLHGIAGKVDPLIPVGGGVVVTAGDQVAGAVSVSGATEEDDHVIAAHAASALTTG